MVPSSLQCIFIHNGQEQVDDAQNWYQLCFRMRYYNGPRKPRDIEIKLETLFFGLYW